MAHTSRVILTGLKQDGTSTHEERFVEESREYDAEGNVIFKADLPWGTPDGTYAVGPDSQPSEMTMVPFFPGPGGTRACIFKFPPAEGFGEKVSAGTGPGIPGLLDVFEADRPGFHTTDSIDYIYILSGRIRLELDDGGVDLESGDWVVQRGTAHAWHNVGEGVASILGIIVGAERKA